jgi:hypothetical protein
MMHQSARNERIGVVLYQARCLGTGSRSCGRHLTVAQRIGPVHAREGRDEAVEFIDWQVVYASGGSTATTPETAAQ